MKSQLGGTQSLLNQEAYQTKKLRRPTTCVVAVASGVFLLLSGTHGPIGTYQLVMEQLPRLTQNQEILQTVNALANILIAVALAGGFAVIAGGILILVNHVNTGRLAIGLGSGVGIPWLILLGITLVTTQQLAVVIAEYSTIGWTGMLLALAAALIAK